MDDIVITEKSDGALTVLFPAKMSEGEFYDMYDQLHGDDYCATQFRSGTTPIDNRQWIEITLARKQPSG